MHERGFGDGDGNTVLRERGFGSEGAILCQDVLGTHANTLSECGLRSRVSAGAERSLGGCANAVTESRLGLHSGTLAGQRLDTVVERRLGTKCFRIVRADGLGGLPGAVSHPCLNTLIVPGDEPCVGSEHLLSLRDETRARHLSRPFAPHRHLTANGSRNPLLDLAVSALERGPRLGTRTVRLPGAQLLGTFGQLTHLGDTGGSRALHARVHR
ncbi:hypothetical protein R6V09_52900 [Streptomyces sp. W16]|uniref:hypothetical protein n=1 Tax=Streptomyces sp. W16 TaxID=3076631 RepID=UPI00295B191D|nr:hypothetical protein [Streptomyces sp. W16]MDV9178810.1 hypothetical protein [Streptomyces sp. W16]